MVPATRTHPDRIDLLGMASSSAGSDSSNQTDTVTLDSVIHHNCGPVPSIAVSRTACRRHCLSALRGDSTHQTHRVPDTRSSAGRSNRHNTHESVPLRPCQSRCRRFHHRCCWARGHRSRGDRPAGSGKSCSVQDRIRAIGTVQSSLAYKSSPLTADRHTGLSGSEKRGRGERQTTRRGETGPLQCLRGWE